MIELRYNADGKLEYRTRILGYIADKPLGILDTWNDWKIVPSVEKEPVTPVDDGWRTERVTLEVTHCGSSSAANWLWHDAMAEFCPTKAWEIKSVRVVEEATIPVDTANDDKLRESMDRVLREESIKTLSEEISAQNKVIEELKKDKAEDWKAACESARIASGTVYDLKKDKDEWIKAFNILAKIMPGIPVDEDDPVGTAAKIDEAIRRQMTNMSTLIESYARDNRPCDWMRQEMYRLGFGDIKSGINADCVAMLSEKYEQVRNDKDKYVEAFGLLTTLCPHLEINYDDPMGMAKTIEKHILADRKNQYDILAGLLSRS